jgi:hypothetical protein
MEIAPGIELYWDNESASLHIIDAQGEVVMWTWEEIAEDSEAWIATIHATVMAATLGPEAVRAWLETKGYQGPGFTTNPYF